ncbi:MAG: NUDIX domain-containing protein [Chloroflexi bacterium]|nr:NUDIX domain-containing protein [Chloroflexota bacterium]
MLLIRRDDTRTWSVPGGMLEPGELPDKGATREVEEETGLKVLPVRLVALYYLPDRAGGFLSFSFRCLLRGGEIRPSEETPQVAYVATHPLPRPMLSLHQERIERGIKHSGGPPYWGRQSVSAGLYLFRYAVAPFIYNYMALRRRARRQPRYQSPPPWQVGAFVVVRDAAGQVLWVRRRDHDVWNLPGGADEPGEAPWETAVRETREETGLAVRLADLSGVYVKTAENKMLFTFTAEVTGGTLTPNAEAAGFAYFAPGQEPANTLPRHVERVADATRPRDTTVFRLQDGPSGLEVLGLKIRSQDNQA